MTYHTHSNQVRHTSTLRNLFIYTLSIPQAFDMWVICFLACVSGSSISDQSAKLSVLFFTALGLFW